jgi:hypothetical protein
MFLPESRCHLAFIRNNARVPVSDGADFEIFECDLALLITLGPSRNHFYSDKSHIERQNRSQNLRLSAALFN